MAVIFATCVSLLLTVTQCRAWTLGQYNLIESNKKADSSISSSRRQWIQKTIVASTSVMVSSNVAHATEEKQGLLSTTEVAALLHPVPTFTIVDKRGVPFMVVGEDAKVTGYFFTTYGEAARILKLAKDSANKAIVQAKKEGKSPEEIGSNPWVKARISSIPLDSAITLVSKSTSSFGGGNFFRSEFQWIYG